MEDIYMMCEEEDVKFIRLQFVDIFGALKNVAITRERLQEALDGKIMFDGSSIEGFVRIEESDMYLMPDPNTFVILPWRSQQGKVARLVCDVYKSDGKTPFEGCPRNILKSVIAEAKKMDFDFYAGPELEFFLFQTDEKGDPTLETHDQAGYFDLGPMDLGENARRDMVMALQEMGFEVEASHHEVAPGQHEIDFKYNDALTSADQMVTFKLVIKTTAQRHGLHATFMPKPVYGVNGSGMHINQSLFKNGHNAFFDSKAENQISQTALYYIGGLLKHIKEITAITNPLVNSYKRLVPGFEAPVYIAWSASNRTSLVRIPASRGETTRLELRNPDPSANPYLALAVVLAAGLDGIKNKIKPPMSQVKNIFSMSEEEREEEGIDRLPSNLGEAIECMENSTFLREVLGEHVFETYLRAKKLEWNQYQAQIHQWEINQYLAKF